MPKLYFSLCSPKPEPLINRIIAQCESFLENKCFLESGANSFSTGKIRERLKKCDALIIVINEDAIPLLLSSSPDTENILINRIRLEIITATNLNLIIVPLLLDDTMLPEKRNVPGALKRFMEYKTHRLRRDYCFDDLHQLLEDIEGELDFKDEIEKKLSEPFQFNFFGRSESTSALPEANKFSLESCGPSGFDRVIDSENLILADARRKGDRTAEKDALSALGLTYARLGQTQKAIQYFQKQLEILRELSDEEEKCGLLANLGDAFAISGKIEQAKEYYQEQLSLARSRDYFSLVGSAYNGLGFVCIKQGEYERGVEFYLKALSIYRELENHDKELELLVGIGLNYQKTKKLKLAIEFFERALIVTRYLENRKEEARVLVDMTEVWFQQGDLNQAEIYLVKAEESLLKLKKPWVNSLLKRLKILRESLNRT